MSVTELGAKALELGDTEHIQLLNELFAGSQNISAYTAGVCYDAVAFCWVLAGWLEPDRLFSGGGQHLLSVFDFDQGTRWQGEDIAPGSAVGFKRLEYDPGFFHAAVAVGGTIVRGTNSYVTTPDWSMPFDLRALDQADGHHILDQQPIEVWYR